MSGSVGSILHLPLERIDQVSFYRREPDGLVFCDVQVGPENFTYHERLEGWDRLLKYFESLSTYRGNWLAAVDHPLIGSSRVIAFCRT